MESNSGSGAYAWEALYEKAITDPDPITRRQRLLEAEQAVLERAKALDDDPGEHESEAEALEEAADVIREMRLETQTDGQGRQVDVGESEELPAARSPRKDSQGQARG